MTKSTKYLVLGLAAVAIVFIAILAGIAIYDSMDHAQVQSPSQTISMNTALTLAARKSGRLQQDEVLITESIRKEAGGDTQVQLKIYALKEGITEADALAMDGQAAAASTFLQHVGYATAVLKDGSLQSVTSLETNYIL